MSRWALPLLWVTVGCFADDAADEPLTRGGAANSGSGGRSGTAAAAGMQSPGGGAGVGGGGAAGGGSGRGETGRFVGVTAAHNTARAQVAGTSLPELSWSEELAEFAQEWSDDLATRCGVIEHRDQNSYGENIALRGSSRLGEPFAPEEAVAGWVAEEECWEFGTIRGSERCDETCASEINSNGCGHYTQVVWRNTERLGCGYSVCNDAGVTFEIWVCNYDPPGNFIGQAPY